MSRSEAHIAILTYLLARHRVSRDEDAWDEQDEEYGQDEKHNEEEYEWGYDDEHSDVC